MDLPMWLAGGDSWENVWHPWRIAHVNYDVQDYETLHLNMEARRLERLAEAENNNQWGWQPPN